MELVGYDSVVVRACVALVLGGVVVVFVSVVRVWVSGAGALSVSVMRTAGKMRGMSLARGAHAGERRSGVGVLCVRCSGVVKS